MFTHTALAHISAIFKSGDSSLPVNYRPIALTDHLMKIFERIIKKAIMKHLTDNNLFNDTQHGFRPNRSTISQLLFFYDDIISKLESGGDVDAIYLDFAKAFDKVDHNVLLEKLRHLRIEGKVLAWITCFLKNRKQIVTVKTVYHLLLL